MGYLRRAVDQGIASDLLLFIPDLHHPAPFQNIKNHIDGGNVFFQGLARFEGNVHDLGVFRIMQFADFYAVRILDKSCRFDINDFHGVAFRLKVSGKRRHRLLWFHRFEPIIAEINRETFDARQVSAFGDP
jgi:hypothetical protein